MLQGERVTLRPMRHEDLERHLTFTNDVEIELLGGGDPPRPTTREGIEHWYAETGSKTDDNSVRFAIEADGKFIGTCGIWQYDRMAGTCAMGIGIGDRDYWGKGYGREAVGLLLHYTFTLLNFRRIWLTTHSANERAVRCYRACGFVEEGRKRQHLWSSGRYLDEVHMGLLREEWEKTQ